jgi:hypothetical protein
MQHDDSNLLIIMGISDMLLAMGIAELVKKE